VQSAAAGTGRRRLAYGFRNSADGELWLVYDFGGGTFDAAVIQLRDGLFRVVNHGGDRHLGGKLLDWAVVTETFVPALLREHPLEDFQRGNPRWRAAFAKLKMAAENAKIRLSRDVEAEVCIDPLCIDAKGERVVFEYELKQAEVERLLDPLVTRSLNICKRVLAEKRLGPGDVARVLLVGGSTLTPALRRRLSDPKDGLGIPLEYSIDPMTIVARGAALFAATQRLETATAPVATGTLRLQLEYEPVGCDPAPLVGGKVLVEAGQDLTGYTIEFVAAEAQPPRRTGRIRLASKGAFVTNLWAEKGRVHTFLIELRDSEGRLAPTEPDRLTYTLGAVATNPPLTHSLGVATASNEMDVFLAKGTSLPAGKRKVHRTAFLVRKGQAGDVLRLPVVEGENVRRADRNRLIGTLLIAADQLDRDLPALTEIEISIEIDTSRLLNARAYIPLLDKEFDQVIRFDQGAVDLDRLTGEIAEEKRRLSRLRRQAEELGNPSALRVLRRVDEERLLHELDADPAAGRGDADAADKCQSRLIDLKSAVDAAEFALETPALLEKLQSEWADLQALVQAHGDGNDKQRAEVLQGEVRQARAAQDPDVLNGTLKGVRRLAAELNWQQPGYLLLVLNYLDRERGTMRDQAQAGRLLERAQRARRAGDWAGLRDALQQLIGLPPPEKRGLARGHGGATYA